MHGPLASVTIGNSVTSIGKRAFYHCTSLEKATIYSKEVTFDSDVFSECPDLTLYGYAGSTTETYAEENSIPFVVLVEDPTPNAKATISLSNETGRAGDKVSVIVSLETDELINTIGVSGITYDKNVLTFDGFTEFDEVKNKTVLSSFDEDTLTVAIALKDAQTFNGKLFALNFIINENAADGTNVVDVSSVIKLDSTEIVVNDVAGSVTVISEVLGDVNHDEVVNMNDAVLVLQHSVFPEIYPVEYKGSLDFNKDGAVDMNDAVLVLQYSLFPDLYPIA